MLYLRFQEKLSNFFNSVYSNSAKYNSSYLVYLRLLFERNNKFKSTFEKLGNVFRNSKWNNFKVQNIKTSLVNSWFFLAVSLTISTLALFSFFGYQTQFNSFFVPAFLSEILGFLFFLTTCISNTLMIIVLKVSFFFFSLNLWLSRLFNFNSNFVFDTFLETKPTNKSQLVKNKNTLTVTPNFHLNQETIEVCHSLSKVSLALSKLYDSQAYEQFVLSLKINHHVPLELLLLETINLNYVDSCKWKPSQFYQKTKSYVPKLSFLNKTVPLTLNNLNNLNNYNLSFSLSQLNVYTNINQAKQNRWLLKNSLLSNTVVKDLYYFTQTKNLIGNSLYNSLSTSSNIWNSSKLTQLSKSSELLKLSLLQNSPKPENYNNFTLTKNTPAGLQNFNVFEYSKLWNIKKYFFTNQLKLNTLQTINTPYTVSDVNTSNTSNNLKLATLLNLHSYSLVTQTQKLFTSICYTNLNSLLTKDISRNNKYHVIEAVNDSDHLRSPNIGFLTTLTSINNSSVLPIYVFTCNKNSISKITYPLIFKEC